jgi:hypothetical protein
MYPLPRRAKLVTISGLSARSLYVYIIHVPFRVGSDGAADMEAEDSITAYIISEYKPKDKRQHCDGDVREMCVA